MPQPFRLRATGEEVLVGDIWEVTNHGRGSMQRGLILRAPGVVSQAKAFLIDSKGYFEQPFGHLATWRPSDLNDPDLSWTLLARAT